jgi:hypothetical protein
VIKMSLEKGLLEHVGPLAWTVDYFPFIVKVFSSVAWIYQKFQI